MTFLEHLDELRRRIWYSFIALIVTVIPAWMFHDEIYDILARPLTQYLPGGDQLAYTTLTAPFMVYIKVSFLAAIFISSPIIFFQFWLFIAPGLYQREKKYVIPFVFFTTVFFILGALFGYFVAFPFACNFFLKMGSKFKAVITVDQYFSLAIRLLLGIALVFEMPTLIFFLARMGIVTSGWMIRNFKYAFLAIFIIAAVITPSPDVMNQTIIAVPMLALYGLGILIALIFGKKKRKESDDELAG